MKLFVCIALACIAQVAFADDFDDAVVRPAPQQPQLTPEEWQAAQVKEIVRRNVLKALTRVSGNLDGLNYYRDNYEPTVRDLLLDIDNESRRKAGDLIEDSLRQVKELVKGKKGKQVCYLNAEQAAGLALGSLDIQLDACINSGAAAIDKQVRDIDNSVSSLRDLVNHLKDLLASCSLRPDEDRPQQLHVEACSADRLKQLSSVEIDLDKNVRQLIANGEKVSAQAVQHEQQCVRGPDANLEKDIRQAVQNANRCVGGH